jgi:hypothetical protein
MHSWRERLRDFWNQRLAALAIEVARGKRERRPPADPRPDDEPGHQKKDDR